MRAICIIISNLRTEKQTQRLKGLSWPHVDKVGENSAPRPSMFHFDTFLHIHHVFQRWVSLLPIILSKKHKSQQELLGGLQRNMPPKQTHLLVLSDRQVCKWCSHLERTKKRRSWACSQGEKPGLPISRPVLFFLIPLIGEVNSFYHEEKLSECQNRGLVSMTNERIIPTVFQWRGVSVHFHATYVPQ